MGFPLVYQSEPINYAWDPSFVGLLTVNGVAVVPNPTPTANYRLIAMAGMDTGGVFHIPEHYLFTWDAVTGQHLETIHCQFSLATNAAVEGMTRSRAGRLYFYYVGIGLGDPTILISLRYPSGEVIDSFPSPIGMVSCPLIDELSDVFLDVMPFWGQSNFDATTHARGNDQFSTNVVVLARLSTGEWLKKFTFPELVVATCLADEKHAYFLCADGNLYLLDYNRGVVLGAGKLFDVIDRNTMIQNVQGIASGWTIHVALGWDWTNKRLLVVLQQPDSNGAGATRVAAYRVEVLPERITKPIPLRYPRKGQTVPMYTQLVGARNEGIGTRGVRATVTDKGQLLSPTAITGPTGGAVFSVLCLDTGDITMTVTVE